MDTSKKNKKELIEEVQMLRSRLEELKQLDESLKQYQFMVESAYDAIFFKDLNGRYIFANDKTLELFGLSREQVIGKNDYDIMPNKKEAGKNIEDDNLVFKTGKMAEILKRMTDGDGKERWFEAIKVPQLNDKGDVIGLVGIARDITERKHLEEAYHSLVDSSLQGLAIVQDGRMVFLNKAFSSTTGYSKEDLLAVSPEQLQSMVHPDDRELVWARHRDRLAGKPVPPRYEFRWIRKDGSTCWVEIYASSIEYQGRPAIQAAYVDITERKKAEEEFIRTKGLLQAAIEQTPAGIVIADAPDVKIRVANSAALGIRGETTELLVEIPAEFHPERWQLFYLDGTPYKGEDLPLSRAILKGQITKNEEIIIRQQDGEDHFVLVNAAPVRDAEGRVIAGIAIFPDITERKKAQQKLIEYQRQLKSLASELLLAEERERRRIATGVHDDIGQKLVLAKLELQSMNKRVSEPDVSASLGHVCELVNQAMQDARSLAFDLSNPVLYEVGFTAAVESLLTERVIEKSGIKSEFKSKTHKLRLGHDTSIVLFQAVQELLTNVVKHANANKVKVCIDKSDHRVQVIVEDDGVGFELSGLKSPDKEKGGFGLFNVKERLEYLGGSFDIESKPGQGTRVTMAVPPESSVTVS